MTQKEVVRTLLDQAKIEPGFTELGKKSYSLLIGAFYAETNKSVAHRCVCAFLMHFVE